MEKFSAHFQCNEQNKRIYVTQGHKIIFRIDVSNEPLPTRNKIKASILGQLNNYNLSDELDIINLKYISQGLMYIEKGE